ncbi:Glycogenin belongs the GT 8 family and initiates the biosynthesis of glycogen [Aspergillus parasiticus SU-1]|uniref:Glycogenin belongs the GT 8 family and initiates the biosynthesis of glycogen n=1 Tax=Aspergillus parasiticus (strain ATCC 56775 / NRRL 5862 / SRRC 143 / SU-1) TaxID=1403190 RepID=A0A0F0I5V3_ASPPU|nr:Glycogenin belongs the GT 8 family and initiates the biosynthesis of glycogen [Aspergillus parasiticus SU-1]
MSRPLGWRSLSPVGKCVVLVAGTALALALIQGIALMSQPITVRVNTPSINQNSPQSPFSVTPAGTTSPIATESAKASPKSKYAFATIITGEGDTETEVKDAYFIATRLLTYQLLHSPQTQSRSGHIPFLVLVTEDIPQEQRDILAKEGATVISAETLEREWIHPKWSRWIDVLAKLNLWRLTEFEKIAFMDADSIILHPLDDIFTDPTTDVQQTVPPQEGADGSMNITVPLPETYLLSGIHDRWVEMALPPVPGKEFYVANNYMNAGFFVCSPSKLLFDYYVSLLDTPDRFDASYPEQNLLNFAHKTDGRMPWREMGPGWNHKPIAVSKVDLDNFKSLHQKWWRPIADKDAAEYIHNLVQEMEGFFQHWTI